MAHELIISDFSAAVLEKERLSPKSLPDCWETVTYETAEIDGTLLIASEQSDPKPVTVDPALSGWYRIYVCVTELAGGNYIELKLTDDEFPSTVTPGKINRYTKWIASEQAEEAFLKCADMTGQRVTISKSKNGIPHTANLLWLRFVAMSEDEVETELARRADLSRKTMLAHMDGDFHGKDYAILPHDYCKAIYAMKDSDVGIVSVEVMNDLVDYSEFDAPYAPRAVGAEKRMAYFRHLYEQREAAYPEMISYAHEKHMKLFAAHRMQLSTFAFPYENPTFTVPFVNEHPEYRCAARDGSWVDFLSYGYEAVQDFMIGNILESARFGFDGVHLIFDRGQHLLFEKPVEERYRAKYGSDDFYRLPLYDARLVDVRSEILTEFLVKLRDALKGYAEKNQTEPMKIYITSYFTYEDSLQDGFDVERFAAAGVIDGVIQTKMRVWEDLDGVLAEDGLIDLQKYREKAKTEYVILRDHASNMERIVEGLPKLREITDRYNLAFYSENQWENAQPAESYVKAAKVLYRAGCKGLALWDCYPVRVHNIGEWSATAHLGKAEEVFAMSEERDAYHKIIKMLSYGGKNVLYYHPSWRG